jgi:chromosome segregation ATPase
MEKLSKHVESAKEALKTLEADHKAAEEKGKNARLSKEKAEADLTGAKARLVEAERAVEDALTGIAGGIVPAEDLKTARAAVSGIQGEIEDLEAVVKAHVPVESRIKSELDDLRQRLMLERKIFWAMIAEEIEEKARKAVGDLLRQALGARELAGWYVFGSTGDHLARMFFDSSTPKLEEEKAALVERYLK